MRRYLDETGRLRQVDGGIPDLQISRCWSKCKKSGEEWRTHFGQENCIHERAMLEMGQNPHPLDLASGTMNIGFSQVFSICLE